MDFRATKPVQIRPKINGVILKITTQRGLIMTHISIFTKVDGVTEAYRNMPRLPRDHSSSDCDMSGSAILTSFMLDLVDYTFFHAELLFFQIK